MRKGIQMKIRTGIVLLGLGFAAQASLGQTFLYTNDFTLFRTSDNGVTTDQFTLGADLTSLAVDPATGNIYGAARTDSNNNGFFELYQLTNAFGTPTLSLVGDFLEQNTPSLSFVNGQLLGFQQEPGGTDNSQLISIDLNMLTQSTIDADLGQRHQASGYRASDDTLFANTGGNPGVASLWTVPYNDADVVSQLVGTTGQETITNGGEFYEGTYYQVVNTIGGGLTLGSLDTATGVFTELFSTPNTNNGAIGLAVVPAPGVATGFAMLGFAGLRRKR